MSEIGLQYLGKKNPFKLSMPRFKNPLHFSRKKGDLTWLDAGDAEWLMNLNPCMFSVGGRRDSELPAGLENAADIIEKKRLRDEEEARIDLSMDAEAKADEDVKIQADKDAKADKDEGEFLTCEKCGKQYKNVPAAQRFYNEHIESCEG